MLRHEASTMADLRPAAQATTNGPAPFSTMVFTLSQNIAEDGTYSDHLAIIFGIATTLLAALSIFIGYMQFRLCKKLHSLQRHDVEMNGASASTSAISEVAAQHHQVETASCAATLCGEVVAQDNRVEDAAAGVAD